MGYWELLELEPTTDVLIIKKAYARKLKSNHPEDNPQGFQKIREAYDKALLYAKNNGTYYNAADQFHEQENDEKINYELNNTEKIFDEQYRNERTNHYQINYEQIEYEIDSDDKLVSVFMGKVYNLYNDFFERINVDNWELLFKDDIMWHYDTLEYISIQIMDFFSNHYYMPREVWKCLERYLYWEKLEDGIISDQESFGKYLQLQLGSDRVPKYNFFDKKLSIDYDQYLYYRENAFLALLDSNLELADTYIRQAFQIYQSDPYLYCIKGEFIIKSEGDLHKADMEYVTALDITNGDWYVNYYRAQVLYDIKLYDAAFQACQNCASGKDPLNSEFLILFGKTLIKTDRLKAAEDLFIDNLEENPEDTESRKCLNTIINVHKKNMENSLFYFQLRGRLKRCFEVLGEPERIKECKFSITRTGKLLLKIILIIFGGLICIAFVVGSRGLALVIALIIWKTKQDKHKK